MNPVDDSSAFKDEVLRLFKTVREDIGAIAEKLDRDQRQITTDVNDLKVEMATMKMKLSFLAGLYGILGGAIPALIMLLLRNAK